MSRRILAFGDSLTQGYYHWGRGKHPYSIQLQANIDNAFSPKTFEVVALGVPGETTDFMEVRLSKLLTAEEWAFVIIMGGTNDLGTYSSDEVIKNLSNMYQQVINAGASLVALTIPTSKHKIEEITEKRTTVNTWIKQNEMSCLVVDIHDLVPYDDEHEEMWDDGLHFTPKGYDAIGAHVFKALQPKLEEYLVKNAVVQESCSLS